MPGVSVIRLARRAISASRSRARGTATIAGRSRPAGARTAAATLRFATTSSFRKKSEEAGQPEEPHAPEALPAEGPGEAQQQPAEREREDGRGQRPVPGEGHPGEGEEEGLEDHGRASVSEDGPDVLGGVGELRRGPAREVEDRPGAEADRHRDRGEGDDRAEERPRHRGRRPRRRPSGGSFQNASFQIFVIEKSVRRLTARATAVIA